MHNTTQPQIEEQYQNDDFLFMTFLYSSWKTLNHESTHWNIRSHILCLGGVTTTSRSAGSVVGLKPSGKISESATMAQDVGVVQ